MTILTRALSLAKVYKPLVEKYAKLNNIELVNDNGVSRRLLRFSI